MIFKVKTFFSQLLFIPKYSVINCTLPGNASLDATLPSLRDKFHILVQMQYLTRSPYPQSLQQPQVDTMEVPVLGVAESELFLPPNLNLKCLSLLSQGKESEDPGDIHINWRINADRFHQDARYRKTVTLGFSKLLETSVPIPVV